ncbi:MAG: hypothetical protein D4Q77_03910 [Methanothrix sp.]|nr:MAG: hypothetical protein D4Q77_03910 [Methanothrix sp.]
MKVIERSLSNKALAENDYRDRFELEVQTGNDTVRSLAFADGEPEDANMARDFNGVFNIVLLLKAAYDAGKNGETWSHTEEDLED